MNDASANQNFLQLFIKVTLETLVITFLLPRNRTFGDKLSNPDEKLFIKSIPFIEL